MNPLRLLHLWRERWGGDNPPLPNARLPTYNHTLAWGGPLAEASLWSMRGVTLLVLILAVAMLLIGALTVLDSAEQSVLAVVMLALGFYVRARAGTLALLILCGLALLSGARYLAWRILHASPPGDTAAAADPIWMAELFLLLVFACWLATQVWPLYQQPEDLDETPEQWPYLDVVLQLDDMDVRRATALSSLVERQAWPAAHLRVFVERDGSENPELAAFMKAHGYEWIEATNNFDSKPAHARLTIPAHSNGEYLVLVGGDADTSIFRDPLLFQRCIAWLERDQTLALLHSAGHPLTNPLSNDAADLLDTERTGGMAILRRHALQQLSPSATSKAIDDVLEDAGFRVAVVGHPSARVKAPTTTHQGWHQDWLRIDTPTDGRSVRMRTQLLALARLLLKGLPVALAVLAVAVLAIPVLGATPINASFGWFASYAAPYAILVFLAWSRTHARFQRPLWSELLDWAQAAVLPPLVAIHAARARARGTPLHSAIAEGQQRIASPLPWILLASLAIAGAISRYGDAEPAMRPWLVFAALIATYTSVLQIAQWAVEQEVQTLRRLNEDQRTVAAKLRLADRHVVPVRTSNFPELDLALELPAGLAARDLDGSLRLALESNGQAASLDGTGRLLEDGRLLFRLQPGHVADYQRFVASLREQFLRQHYWLPKAPPTLRWIRTLGFAQGSNAGDKTPLL